MIHFPSPLHSPQDDLPPRDYTYVHSVGEGRRRAQLKNIHPETPDAPQAVDEYGIPENPYVQSAPPRRSRAARSEASNAAAQPPSFAPRQPQQQFNAPASIEMPDWLRVAQQNNYQQPSRPAPRVQAAPRRDEQPSVYEQAGYPRQLLEEQRLMERQAAATPVRRRHGAQYATRPAYEPEPPAQPTGMSYPPPRPAAQQPPAPMPRAYHQPQPQEDWQVETDEEDIRRELPGWMKKVPWIGIAAFAAVLTAVLIWISGLNAEKQTQQVFEQRAAQEASIVENHPLQYQDIIAEKAQKYNLNPAFIAAIIMNESSFRPDAVAESTGARGLMQLVYDTAEWIHGKVGGGSEFRHNDLHDPALNMEYGCWYLNYLSKQFGGDPILVAAAFHAGQGEVRTWLQNAQYSPDGRTVAIDRIPFGDTRRYVTRVVDDFAVYQRVYYGK